jgi:hypothetical protein
MLTFGVPATHCIDVGDLVSRVVRRYRFLGGFAKFFPSLLETQHSDTVRAKIGPAPDPVILNPSRPAISVRCFHLGFLNTESDTTRFANFRNKHMGFRHETLFYNVSGSKPPVPPGMSGVVHRTHHEGPILLKGCAYSPTRARKARNRVE